MATPMEEDLPGAEAEAAGPAPPPAAATGGDGDGENPAPAPASPFSDSDSDSDDGGEGGDAADELRIQALEQALQEQPLDYESHVQVSTISSPPHPLSPVGVAISRSLTRGLSGFCDAVLFRAPRCCLHALDSNLGFPISYFSLSTLVLAIRMTIIVSLSSFKWNM